MMYGYMAGVAGNSCQLPCLPERHSYGLMGKPEENRTREACAGRHGVWGEEESGLAGHAAVSISHRDRVLARLALQSPALWTSSYLRQASVADVCCGFGSGLLAYIVRFGGAPERPSSYLAMSLILPLAWLITVLLAGGYDSRFIGVGTDEFRKILNSGLFLTATVAIFAYAGKTRSEERRVG